VAPKSATNTPFLAYLKGDFTMAEKARKANKKAVPGLQIRNGNRKDLRGLIPV
jgi:hypothetical protein